MSFVIPLNLWHAITYMTLAFPNVGTVGCDLRGVKYPFDPFTMMVVSYAESRWELDNDKGGAYGPWQLQGTDAPGSIQEKLKEFAQSIGVGSYFSLYNTSWYATEATISSLALRQADLCAWTVVSDDPSPKSNSTGYWRPQISGNWTIGQPVVSTKFTSIYGIFSLGQGYIMKMTLPSFLNSGERFTVTVEIINTASASGPGSMLGVMPIFDFDPMLQFNNVVASAKGGLLGNLPVGLDSSWSSVLIAGHEIPLASSVKYVYTFTAPNTGGQTNIYDIRAKVTGDNLRGGILYGSLMVGPKSNQIYRVDAYLSSDNAETISTGFTIATSGADAALNVKTVSSQGHILGQAASGQVISHDGLVSLKFVVSNVGGKAADNVLLNITGMQGQQINLGTLQPGESKVVTWQGQPSILGTVNAKATAVDALPSSTSVQTEPPPSSTGQLSPLLILGGAALASGVILLSKGTK